MDHPWFTVVKYTSALFTAGYGLYATVTDFKVERKDGRKILSRKGYIGIGILIVSSVLSLSTNAIKDAIDSREKAAKDSKEDQTRLEITGKLREQLETSRQMAETLQTEQKVSAEISKTLGKATNDLSNSIGTSRDILELTKLAQPLTHLRIFLVMLLPTKNEDMTAFVRNVDSYLEPRLPQLAGVKKEYGIMFPDIDNNVEVSVGQLAKPIAVRFKTTSTFLSNAYPVGAVVAGTIAHLEFYPLKSARVPRARPSREPGLRIELTGSGQDRPDVQYRLDTGRVEANWSFHPDRKHWDDPGMLISIPDLLDSYVCVDVAEQVYAEDADMNQRQQRIRRELLLDYLTIQNEEGRQYWLTFDRSPQPDSKGMPQFCGRLSEKWFRGSN